MNGTENTTLRTSPNCENRKAGSGREWRTLLPLV
jgi:hypothetical protein